MESVTIMTRDINGKRAYHILKWDEVCGYVQTNISVENEEILMVVVGSFCVYSAIQSARQLEWEELIGFFA